LTPAAAPIAPTVPPATPARFVFRLRGMALRGLPRMYVPEEHAFVFRLRAVSGGIVSEGRSFRYAAIALIGLATETDEVARSILGGATAPATAARLVAALPEVDNLGDVALALWATRALGVDTGPARQRLLAMRPQEGPQATVELAWALTALCEAGEAVEEDLRRRLARRLLDAFVPGAGLFPHRVGESGRGLRAHVSCFADLAYPIQALAAYVQRTGDAEARAAALACARAICRHQGPAGQWWWHYDVRTGALIEPYPVYAVHQDAMAPLALFALEEATGESFDPWLARGLQWLERSPELGGGSLVDEKADLIWRKVARREFKKVSRYVQAAASRLSPRLRAPGIDWLLPPGVVDREDRPYHLGWLLHAWPASRAAAFAPRPAAR
jgi:hypothetical protein